MQAALEEYVRSARVATSNIALSSFMQGLFEDKLQVQKEALLQGKQLADIIAMQAERDSGELEARASQTTSMPAAAHTITNGGALRGGSLGLALGLGALFVVLAGVGGGALWWMKHAAQRTAAAAATQAAPAPVVPKGSIEVTSDPPGASIWIDGDLRADVTPAVIGQLPLGSPIDVKLTKDGFEQTKETITLSLAGPDGKVRSLLRRGSVSLDVSVKPAGAPVTMIVDGKPTVGTALDGLSSGSEHKVVVGAPGYSDQTLSFIGQPMEKKHLDVTLEKAPRPSGGRATSQAAPTAPQPGAGSGKLNVGASGGWCNVSVDGAPRGATPVAGIELPSGSHKVSCTTTDGKTQTATVIVTADATARYKFNL
jgi:serine/threonine-protein kinase